MILIRNNWLRWLALVLCAPSGASLLAYVFGVAPLNTTATRIVLPSCVGLIVVACFVARRGNADLIRMLQVGFVGGLVGTLAYDLYRIPFQWAGHRVFVPIQVYGVWILNVHSSTPLTDLVGWLYHFSNGITFGIAYALCLPGKRWFWGIVWGFILETIAVITPFGRIFALRGNASALLIAYTGHIAYGIPLGWLVYRWKETAGRLAIVPAAFYRFVLALGIIVLFAGIIIAHSHNEPQHQLAIQGSSISPDILRVSRGERITIYNSGPDAHTIEIPALKIVLPVSGKQSTDLTIRKTGIFQVRVQTKGRTRSSFLIVEPVYDDR